MVSHDAPETPDLTVLDSLESELADIERVVERIEAGEADELSTADSRPLQSGPPPNEEHAMGFGIDKLGHWTEGPEFKVEADRTKAYAAATNDPNAAHVAGEVAPPVFAVVPIWDTMAGAMAGIVPPEVLMLVVHGEQDMRFHQPIVPGSTLRSKAAPVGVHVKPNGTIGGGQGRDLRPGRQPRRRAVHDVVLPGRERRRGRGRGGAGPQARRRDQGRRSGGGGDADARRRPDLSLRRGLG